MTVDSIILFATTDDYAVSFVKRSSNGYNGALVDAVTASTNGNNTFYQRETTITSASIASQAWIGIKRPTVAAKGMTARIHFH